MGGGELKRTKSPKLGPEVVPAEPLEPDIPSRDPGKTGSASSNGEPIIESAERAAARIRADAEAEASRYLEDYKRRVDEIFEEKSQIADALVEQADKIKRHYDRLLSAVDSALEQDPAGAELPSWSEPSPIRSTPTQGGFRPRPRNKISARALAAQMVAAGADREAISQRLRAEYGISDPGALLQQLEL